MAYSQILEKYGNPAQRAGQGIQKRNSINRLMELEQNRVQRADADAAMGPGRTSITGASDYFNRLNEEGEMSGLQNTLAGRRPSVQHSYAGTDFAEGGQVPRQRQSVKTLEDSPSDNLDYFSRLAHVQGQNISNERQRDAEFEESTQDDPVFAARRRATRHADIVDAGGAQGEGAAAAYLAPGQTDARRQKTWDDEAYNQANGPYSQAAIRWSVEMAKQREISDRESQKALINASGRTGSQAIRSYGSIAASEANQGRDVSAQRTEVGSRMPGAAGPDRSVSEEEIAAIASQRGLDPNAVRQYFVTKGYQVGNVPGR